MEQSNRWAGATRMVWAVAGLLVIVAAGAFIVGRVRSRDVKFPTPYQAVVLPNGIVYFGKLEGYGGPHPVLTEVYYIVSQTDPETKKVSNVLVKRGKEMHQPDRMYLNPRQMLFVETVGPSSKVANLIQESKSSQ
ncbi:MAG: hypothetical protein ABSA59_00585 [Terriglobia bacterium]|jgi:hypothetical protein